MVTQKRQKGDLCEQLVAYYLQEKGNRILERNYRCPYGEIDIISLSADGVICVTEVKSLSPRWSLENIQFQVDYLKQKRIRNTLKKYLSENVEIHYSGIRFDVAAVTDGKITYFSEAF